tara:strand:+ start:1202 stop:3166 length:1965 start_codon:yes stop_codon:yes gene_type:complete
MKLKGVNPFTQHIEKIVLGITGLIFLAVVSMQFVTEPNKVDTGTRQVAPDQIFNELASKASTLQSQITDRSPALPAVQNVDLLARYQAAFETSTDSTIQIASALGEGIDIASLLNVPDINSGPRKSMDIEALSVPATSTPLVASTWGTLDPYAVIEVPEYANYVPAAQPFDFPTVSIESDFSGTTLRSILEGTDGYPGVPRLFWGPTGMAIMGLDVERQQLQADGSWSSSQPITPPPGTPLPTNAVTKDDGLVRLNTIIASAQDVADEVMRPMFPPTISGPLWAPPSESVDSADLGLTETQRLQRQLSRLTTQLEGLKKPSTSRSTTSRPSTSSPGRGGGGGKFGTRDPGQTNTQRPSSNDRSKARIEKIEEQIQAIKADLENLGVVSQASLADSATDILDHEFVQLWAHDIGAKPGATYRYRTRVVLNNPYFRKGPYLDEADDAQQALTIEPFSKGQWSDWSDAVDVGAKEFFFVTEANQPLNNAEPPQAKIELFSMYYGFYRRSSMTIEPGQPLLANLRISGDLVLIDTAVLDAENTAQYIEAVNAGTNEAGSGLPDGITSAPDRLSIDLAAYLVQITRDPLQTQNQGVQSSRLIFRLADGMLQHRSSETDKVSQLYEQAQSSSVQASRSQLRPTGQPARSPASDLFTVTVP